MKSNATLKLTQTETSKTVEISIPNEEAENVTAGILKKSSKRTLCRLLYFESRIFEIYYFFKIKASGVSNFIFSNVRNGQRK